MTEIAIVLAISLAIVLLNGIFVAAEFALVSSSRFVFEQQAAGGSRFARRMLSVLSSARRQDRYVATAQLGITLASLGLGMYGEHTLAVLLERHLPVLPFLSAGAIAGGLALTLLTIAHIIIGEMIPKGFALHQPERVVRLAHWPMRTVELVLYPLVAVSNGVANACLRLLGITRSVNQPENLYTPEELQLIVEESEQGGALRADSGRILRELFEFGDLTASQAMVPRVRIMGVPVGATSVQIRAILARSLHTRYPVYDGDLDHIIGMVHVKDLLRRLLLEEPVTTADARRIPVVPETATLDLVLASMQQTNAHLALVIDEHGGTAGLLSLEDLSEEVVGEIDEGAPAMPSLAPQPDGTALAAGTLRLDELGQHFELDLEHDEVESVSGLVLTLLGRPPVVGDLVRYGRVELDVLAISGRGVKQVRARLLPPVEDDG
ncbi:MAG TPA: hemolysin family protein [Vicinamibacterales bacterium]|nr:hemolysin family protein [Vicinamibacterales bacterium]